MGRQIFAARSWFKGVSLSGQGTDETHGVSPVPEKEEAKVMNISLLNNPRGLNYRQITAFKKVLSHCQPITAFHHAGGKMDKVPHDIISVLTPNIHIYPSSDCEFREGIVHETMIVAERNRKLVDVADVIIAAPMMIFEFEDSPTWKTINYAISKEKEVYLLSQRGNTFKVLY